MNLFLLAPMLSGQPGYLGHGSTEPAAAKEEIETMQNSYRDAEHRETLLEQRCISTALCPNQLNWILSYLLLQLSPSVQACGCSCQAAMHWGDVHSWITADAE